MQPDGKTHVISNILHSTEVEVCFLSEMKQKASGHYETLDDDTVLCSGKDCHYGLGIWLSKRVASSHLEHNLVNNCIIYVTFKSAPHNIAVMQCYALIANRSYE